MFQNLQNSLDQNSLLISSRVFTKQRYLWRCRNISRDFDIRKTLTIFLCSLQLDHIFLSRVCSETAGGLPGLLLTLAGMGEEGMSVNVWGPSDLKYLVDAMRCFIPSAAMVHTRSFGPTPGLNAVSVQHSSKFIDPIVLVDDEVVKISAILLGTGSEGSHAHSLNGGNGSALKPGDVSVIYVCELPEIKGKFDPAKAVALGLKAGPKYRELQLGNSVKSDRKNIMVHPSDVMGPSLPGPIVFLVDCPTEAHMQELLSMRCLSNYYADVSDNPTENAKTVSCVIHLSPVSITSSHSYQEWMGRFGSAQHIMAGHEMKNVEVPILKSSAKIATRLNYLCPQFFPAPGFWSLNQLQNSASDAPSEAPPSNLCESILAENLLKFALRPYAQLGLDRSGVPSTKDPSEIITDLLSEIPEISDAAHHVSQFWQRTEESKLELTPLHDNKVMVEEPWLNENILPSCMENIRRDDLEIVLLGTGSSQPSKYRNVSSIYINLFSEGSLLLDCGEGTLGQLKRRYGLEGADVAVRSLRCIWISHIHADHHTGLARILALRRDLLKGVPHEPLVVVGPKQLKRFLDAYQRLEDLDMQFLDCRHTTEASFDSLANRSNTDNSSPGSSNNLEDVNNKSGTGQMAQKIDSTLFSRNSRMQSYWKRPDSSVNGIEFTILKSLQKVLNEAGLESLVSFPVVHCPQAFGVVLKASERINNVGKMIPGWKIVYSGDTRPCPELVEASRGATVLIHEATFEDGLMEEAVAKNHSTTNEAIEAGAAAGVYRIILTHFSQRYPKIPVFDAAHMHKTCIAFDMMSVNIADLPVLPKVLPYVRMLFRDETIVDESEDVVGDPALASF